MARQRKIKGKAAARQCTAKERQWEDILRSRKGSGKTVARSRKGAATYRVQQCGADVLQDRRTQQTYSAQRPVQPSVNLTNPCLPGPHNDHDPSITQTDTDTNTKTQTHTNKHSNINTHTHTHQPPHTWNAAAPSGGPTSPIELREP